MEVFSAVSGAITLLEVATRINKLCVTVKDAPNDWKRYRDGLHAVTCIQNVLATVLSNCPAIRSLVVPADTQQSQIPFTDHVNGVLSEVKEQAKNLLERHGQLSGGWARKQISRVFKPLGFIVDRERIEKMIESVEQAHHHLHMALTLASIKASSSWKCDTSSLLQELQAKMAEHGKVLKEVQQSVQLGQAGLEVDARLHHSIPRSSFQIPFSSRGHRRPRKKKRGDGLQTSSRSTAGPPRYADTANQRGHEEVAGGDISGYSSGDDSGDDEEPLVPSQDIPPGSECAIVLINRTLVQVPINSTTYTLATGPHNAADSANSHSPDTSNAIRVEDVIASLSESEWDETRGMQMEELIEFLSTHATAQPTAYATDVEITTTSSTVPPIRLCTDRESYLLMAKPVDLALCSLEQDSTVAIFCVTEVHITDGMQVFIVTTPCNSECSHLAMQVKHGEDGLAAEELRFKLEFLSLGENLSGIGVLQNSNSSRDLSAVASLRCSSSRGRSLQPEKCRNHTVFKQDKRSECALPTTLQLFSSVQSTTDDYSDAKTERAPSEAGSDGGHETESDQPRGEEDVANGGATFPMRPDAVDDERAFELLRMMAVDEAYVLPSEVEWDVLVRFLRLVDKYGQHVGEKPLAQARLWASLIPPSKTFDENAILWLWVMWKLQMIEEFWELSAVVQKQATLLISQWQAGPENSYGIELPERITSQLDIRRLNILSRVRNKITSLMEEQRQLFNHAVRAEYKAFIFGAGDFLVYSLFFGYLYLERDRLFNPSNQTPEVGDQYPGGLSFTIVKERILSMEDLSDWKICTVPVANRIPTALAMMTTLIPVVGWGLWNEGLHIRLSGRVKLELVQLIREIESEGWGIRLEDIVR